MRYSVPMSVGAESLTIHCPRCGKPMQLLLAAGARLADAQRLARLILCHSCCAAGCAAPAAQPVHLN
jgi:hypothetical protein